MGAHVPQQVEWFPPANGEGPMMGYSRDVEAEWAQRPEVSVHSASWDAQGHRDAPFPTVNKISPDCSVLLRPSLWLPWPFSLNSESTLGITPVEQEGVQFGDEKDLLYPWKPHLLRRDCGVHHSELSLQEETSFSWVTEEEHWVLGPREHLDGPSLLGILGTKGGPVTASLTPDVSSVEWVHLGTAPTLRSHHEDERANRLHGQCRTGAWA
nr:uncharacterized protein LOC129017023 [Pongo pygmaeus]